MTHEHEYDSTCSCSTCRHKELSLQERPERVPIDEFERRVLEVYAHVGQIAAADPTAQAIKQRVRARLFTEPRTEWRPWAVALCGDSPAARAVTDEDLRRRIAQRLEHADQAQQLRHNFEVLARMLEDGESGVDRYIRDVLSDLAGVDVDAALARAGEAVHRG